MPTLPFSPERTGPEARAPDPLYSNWTSSSSSSSSSRRGKQSQQQQRRRRQRTPSSSKLSRAAAAAIASTRKRPNWLHDAIEFKRDPFTSGNCYSFKDRTTSVTSEARAWSDAAHRIDEQRRRTLEKKRVRQRHLATFRAMQRSSYDNQFDGDMTVGGGMSSSIQYVPATRVGVPIASRVPTSLVRQDVASLLGELRSRPPPPAAPSAASTNTPSNTYSVQQQHHHSSAQQHSGLRFSDLRKQQQQKHQQQQQQRQQLSSSLSSSSSSSASAPRPVEMEETTQEHETLSQLAEARHRLDAMEERTLSQKHRVSFLDVDTPTTKKNVSVTENEDEDEDEDENKDKAAEQAEQLALELERTKAALEAAQHRIDTEVALRTQIEVTQKVAVEDTDKVSKSVLLEDVVKERETRKARFDTMLTTLENKHQEEKVRAAVAEKKLHDQIAELMKRLDQSEQQISTLTQAQREKDRAFDGRETA